MTYTSSAVDNCFYCSLPLGGRFTYHWSNRCHFECVPKDEKDIRIIALSAQLEAANLRHAAELIAAKKRIAELEAAVLAVSSALEGEPEYHEQGMGCGLEDRNITDRYEAMAYGWESAMERVYGEHINYATEAIAALRNKSDDTVDTSEWTAGINLAMAHAALTKGSKP